MSQPVSDQVLIAAIAALPAIIAAISSLINHGRLKRTSERTKRIEANVAAHNEVHSRNGV